jgi:type II secretory pathway component PulM
MARAGSKDSTGDKFQIISMTLAMTGGGFLLLTLLFALWWNPGARSDVEALKKDYVKLTDLLKNPDNKRLLREWKISEAQPTSTQSLREIISAGLNSYQLEGSFPKAKVTDQKGIEKVEQSIELKPAPLKSIFQFLGFVKDQKKSIQVEDLGVNRLQRGKDVDADSWTASFSFVDYVPKGKE